MMQHQHQQQAGLCRPFQREYAVIAVKLAPDPGFPDGTDSSTVSRTTVRRFEVGSPQSSPVVVTAAQWTQKQIAESADWLTKIAKRTAGAENDNENDAGAVIISCGDGYDILVLLNDAELPTDLIEVPRVCVALSVTTGDSEDVSQFGYVRPTDSIFDHVVVAIETVQTERDVKVLLCTECAYWNPMLSRKGIDEASRMLAFRLRTSDRHPHLVKSMEEIDWREHDTKARTPSVAPSPSPLTVRGMASAAPAPPPPLATTTTTDASRVQPVAKQSNRSTDAALATAGPGSASKSPIRPIPQKPIPAAQSPAKKSMGDLASSTSTLTSPARPGKKPATSKVATAMSFYDDWSSGEEAAGSDSNNKELGDISFGLTPRQCLLLTKVFRGEAVSGAEAQQDVGHSTLHEDQLMRRIVARVNADLLAKRK